MKSDDIRITIIIVRMLVLSWFPMHQRGHKLFANIPSYIFFPHFVACNEVESKNWIQGISSSFCFGDQKLYWIETTECVCDFIRATKKFPKFIILITFVWT